MEYLEERQLLAPLAWSAGPDLPAARAAGAAVGHNGSIYEFGGVWSGPGTQSVPRLASAYPSWSGSWSFGQPVGRPDTMGVGKTASGILLFGGNAADPIDEALRYDAIFGDHQDAGRMNSPRARLAFATEANTPFAIGGLDDSGSVLSSVERYDAGADAWTLVAPMPGGRFAFPAASDGAGHIYTFGGATENNANSVSTTVYRYSVATDAWDIVTPMTIATRDSTAVFAPDGKFYVLGGMAADGTTAAVQAYDPATDSWAIETALPAPVSAASAAVDARGRINVIGGYDATGTVVATVAMSQSLSSSDIAPLITSRAIVSASLDKAYSYQVTATGNPQPTFSLIVAPAGMSIDSVRGLITWQPAIDQIGPQSVTIRAASSVGQNDQSFTINVVADTTAPSVPTGLRVTGVSSTTASLAWDASTDNVGVTGYKVFQAYRCGFHGIHTCYRVMTANFSGASAELPGLTPATGYRFTVSAVDAAGNESGKSAFVSTQTTSRPTLQYIFGTLNGPVSVVAKHALSFQIIAQGVPAPAVSLVSGPDGLTFDSATSRVNWTPTADQVGTAIATLRATNSVGSTDLTISITVTPDLPILSHSFNGVRNSVPFAIAEQPFVLQLHDGSLTPSTFSILAGPAGMLVDETTGTVQWLPTVSDVGTANVTFRATNSAGSDDLSLTFPVLATGTDRTPPSTVTDLGVTNVTKSTAELTWTPPSDNQGVAGYRITAWYEFRSRGLRRVYSRFEAPGDASSFVMTGLPANKQMQATITAYDAAGNVSGSSNRVAFVTVNPAGSPVLQTQTTNLNVVAGETLSIQLFDSARTSPTFSLVSGPAGMVIDPVTGVATWTPTLSDVGRPTATFRAENAIGSDVLTLPIPVSFTGAPTGVAVTDRTGSTGRVSWTAPTQNATEIAGYRVYLTWSVGGRQRGAAQYEAGLATSFQFPFLVRGPVLFRVTIAAYNAAAQIGQSSAIVQFT